MRGCESRADGRTERLSGVYNFTRSGGVVGGDDGHNHDVDHDDDDHDGSEYDDALANENKFRSKTRIWDCDDII